MNLFNPDRLITFPADDPQLVKQLQSGTKVYLAKSGDHRYADGWAFAKMAALIIACLCCYALALSQSLWGLYLLWYLAMMFCAMLLAVNVVHDASHDAFLRGKKTNARLNRWVAFPMGLDPDCWRVRHVRFHHGFTNIEFYDPDTAENGILRQTPWQRWRPLCASNITIGHWSPRSPFLVYLGSGLARSRRVYAGHATSGPARLCWLGIFLSRETGALCAVSDTSTAFV